MIRLLREHDYGAVTEIVNVCWRSPYAGFVNPALPDKAGCRQRAAQLEREFRLERLAEYVWEDAGRVPERLSAGATADRDRAEAFEIWRVYLAPEALGQGSGGLLLGHAEQLARARGYRETLVWAFRENRSALRFYENTATGRPEPHT